MNLHGGKYGRIISVKIVYILSVYNGQLRVKCISVSGLIGFKVFLVARFNITFAAPWICGLKETLAGPVQNLKEAEDAQAGEQS